MKEKTHAWIEATEQRYLHFEKERTIHMICSAFLEALAYDYMDEAPKEPEDFRGCFALSTDLITKIINVIRYREPLQYASMIDHIEQEIRKRKDPDTYEAERESEDDCLFHEMDEKG